MADRTLEVQKAVIGALRAHAGLGALVGARVYDRAPQGEFEASVTLGPVFGQPVDAEGVDAWECVVTLDSWSRDYGSVELRQIMAAVVDALHLATLTLDAGTAAWCRLLDARTIREDQGETLHGVQRFEIMVDG